MLLTLLNIRCNILFADAKLFASDTNTLAQQIHHSLDLFSNRLWLGAAGLCFVLSVCLLNSREPLMHEQHFLIVIRQLWTMHRI